MSYYTKFQDVESILSATSTTVLGSTDVVLGYSFTDNKAHAIPVSYIYAGGTASVATTNSTATAIANTGLTLLKSTAGTSSAWTLSDPTAALQLKTIAFVSSTTSTAFTVTTVAASIGSTASFTGTLINFGSTATGAMCNAGNSVTLVSLTSTQWQVIEVKGTATAFTSSLILSTGAAPTYS